MSATQPRYTIEQYELLRRLRATGMTKEEMILAITAMEKLDSDLGPSPEKKIQIKDVHTVPRVFASAATTDNQSVSSSAYPHHASLRPTSRSPVSHPVQRTVQHPVQHSVHHPVQTGSAIQPNSRMNLNNQRGAETTAYAPNVYLPNNPGPGPELVLDLEAECEFQRLLAQDPSKMREDIKLFILGHDISQSWLSKELGILKSNLSQYLSGRGLPKHAIKLLYSWYHLSSRGGQPTVPCRTEVQTRAVFSRRDRLHWSEKELQILETYRKENAYPSMNEVRSMADTLNGLGIEDICGDHRVITPMNVYNWFANRRKDRKRKARETATGQTSDTSGDVESLDSIDDLAQDQMSPNTTSNADNISMPLNTDFFSQISTNTSQRNADDISQLGIGETPGQTLPIPVSLEVNGTMKDERDFVGHVRSLLEN